MRIFRLTSLESHILWIHYLIFLKKYFYDYCKRLSSPYKRIKFSELSNKSISENKKLADLFLNNYDLKELFEDKYFEESERKDNFENIFDLYFEF